MIVSPHDEKTTQRVAFRSGLPFIQAWADWRCLSFQRWAMREPKSRDKHEQIPTLFCIRAQEFRMFSQQICTGNRQTAQTRQEMGMHIGMLIRLRLEEKGKSVVWFSRELSCSRTNVYKIFDKPSINTDMLRRISHILDYDFFKLYSDTLSGKE